MVQWLRLSAFTAEGPGSIPGQGLTPQAPDKETKTTQRIKRWKYNSWSYTFDHPRGEMRMCKEKESAVEVKRHLERWRGSGQEMAIDWKSSVAWSRGSGTKSHLKKKHMKLLEWWRQQGFHLAPSLFLLLKLRHIHCLFTTIVYSFTGCGAEDCLSRGQKFHLAASLGPFKIILYQYNNFKMTLHK